MSESIEFGAAGHGFMRVTNIQAARFVCALAVLLSHLSLTSRLILAQHSAWLHWVERWLTGPALFTFFAISGFVLMHSLPFTPRRQFLLARLLRIYPPFWFAAAIKFVHEYALCSPIPADAVQIVGGLSLAPVGRANAFYPIGVEWSLVFEVAFYTTLGITVLLVSQRMVRPVVVAWLAVVLGRIMLFEPSPNNPYPQWAEMLVSPLTLPFLGGALAAPLTRCPRALAWTAPAAVPLLLVAATQIERWDLAIVASAAGCTLLVARLAVGRQLDPRRWLVRFGDRSYGVYLIHMTVLVPALMLTAILGAQKHAMLWAGGAALIFGLLFGACESAVYRRMKRWVFRPAPAAALPVPRSLAA